MNFDYNETLPLLLNTADSAMTATTTLSVRFECLSAKTITTSEVELPPVSSVQQIKEYFEEKYDIPVCLQTLRRSSVVLRQDTPVASLRLGHGDELQVSYYAKADCQEMHRVVRWLEVFVNCVVHGGEFPQDLDEEQVLEDMVKDLFVPWEMPVKLANKKVFVSHGGLNLTIHLHKYLLSHQWEQLPRPLKLMEGQVLLVLWMLSDNVTFRQVIFNEGGLKHCKKSLLRVPILPNQSLIDKSTPNDSSALLETVERAIGLLSWYVRSWFKIIINSVSGMYDPFYQERIRFYPTRKRQSLSEAKGSTTSVILETYGFFEGDNGSYTLLIMVYIFMLKTILTCACRNMTLVRIDHFGG